MLVMLPGLSIEIANEDSHGKWWASKLLRGLENLLLMVSIN